MARALTEGSCLHLVNDFICSEGKHQNYPCPYRNDIHNCICSLRATKEMVEQYKSTGCLCITYDRGMKDSYKLEGR